MHPSRRQIRESLEAGRYTSVKPRPRRARALVPGLPMTIRETLSTEDLRSTQAQSNPPAILMLRIFMSVRWCLHTFGYRWQRPRLSRCIGRCGIRWSMASVIMIREEGATKGCVRAGTPFTLGAGGLKSCVQTCIRHGRSARRLLPGWSSKHQNTESSHCRVSECDLVTIR